MLNYLDKKLMSLTCYNNSATIYFLHIIKQATSSLFDEVAFIDKLLHYRINQNKAS